MRSNRPIINLKDIRISSFIEENLDNPGEVYLDARNGKKLYIICEDIVRVYEFRKSYADFKSQTEFYDLLIPFFSGAGHGRNQTQMLTFDEQLRSINVSTI